MPTPSPTLPRLLLGLAFERSAHKLSDLPPEGTPEIAFAGRSNAGKSSAINTLAGHNRLAFVSKTPGRTQLINFFRIPNSGFLVDLPGYGYAKVPHDLREHWQATLAAYLAKRKSLVGLVLIMDSRHPLTPLDLTMFDWFRPTGRPIHALLSKSDKLSRSDAAAALVKVRAHLARESPLHSAQLFSSLKKTGIGEAEETLERWLEIQPKIQRNKKTLDQKTLDPKENPRAEGEKPGD